MADTTFTAKEIAQTVGTDPKTFRRFLRSHLRAQDLTTPGQGGRYAFDKKEAKALIAAYTEWSAPKVKAPAAPADDEDLSDEAEDFDLGDEDEVDLDDDGGVVELDDETLSDEDFEEYLDTTK